MGKEGIAPVGRDGPKEEAGNGATGLGVGVGLVEDRRGGGGGGLPATFLGGGGGGTNPPGR